MKYLVVVVLWLALFSNAKGYEKITSICENARRVLRCPAGKTIFIHYAIYGRLRRDICPHRSIKTTCCSSFRSESLVRRMCNGRSQCNLYASNRVFGDPCRGTYKYLSVAYECRQTARPALLTGNIARRKPTAQSTTGPWGGVSSKGSDGNSNPNWNGRSCTATNRQRNPWWRVDLLNSYVVSQVKITNRKDCCWNRLRAVEVDVGMKVASPAGNQRCAYYPGAFGRGETKTLRCSRPVRGKYVFVTLKTTEILTVCEVQVFAIRGSMRTIGQTPIPTKIVNICEHRRVLLRCPHGKVIRIQHANYGRTHNRICSRTFIRNKRCRAISSKGKVSHMCDGRSSCNLFASNSVYGDPCPGVYKYLNVQYRCILGAETPVPSALWRIGDGVGGYELRIGSFANKEICYQKCLTRRYRGRLANGVTVDSRTGKKCYCEFNMKRRNRNRSWRNTFIKRVGTFGGNARGASCVFPFRYKGKMYYACTRVNHNKLWCATTSNYDKHRKWGNCKTQVIRTVNICERRTRILRCPRGQVMKILRANYGRTNHRTCSRKFIRNNRCRARGSFSKVRHSCDGRSQCKLCAANRVYGDPCPGVYKYLHVQYRCVVGRLLTG